VPGEFVNEGVDAFVGNGLLFVTLPAEYDGAECPLNFVEEMLDERAFAHRGEALDFDYDRVAGDRISQSLPHRIELRFPADEGDPVGQIGVVRRRCSGESLDDLAT